MLPGSPAVSLVQNYLRAQQGVIETTRATPDQLLLTVGEQVKATVTNQLPNGRFAVLIKDQLLDLNLPRNTQPGEQLDLVVTSKEPKLTFTLSQSAQPQVANSSSGVALSQTARLLGDLVAEQPAAQNKTATVQQSAPLFEGEPVPEQLASQLATRLAESGLFYESHQAEWVNGERPLQTLLREPQAQIAAQAAEPGKAAIAAKPEMPTANPAPQTTDTLVQPSSTEGAKSAAQPQPTALPAAPEQQLRHLVQQQVQLLENHPLVWQGQAWPGQALQWQLELENERDPAHPHSEPEPVWQSRLDMTLPNLGEVGVVVSLRAGQFALNFEASNPTTVALLRSQQSALAGRFEAAGLSLAMSQVHHHVDEAAS